jgi:UDP-glucose 4-epimerase
VVTVLRFANVLGTDIVTPISANLSRSLCPSVAGYDPLVQFVEEDDVVRCLEHVTRHRVPGLYNVAGAGKLPWSEVAEMCGTRLLPLPPVATQSAAAPMVRLGSSTSPPSSGPPALRPGVDTSRLTKTGFTCRYTSAGNGRQLHPGLRLRRSVGKPPASYTYEQDIEQFFRHSSAVVHVAGDT